MIIEKIETSAISIEERIAIFNSLPWVIEKNLSEELVDFVTYGINVGALIPSAPFVFDSKVYRAIPNSEIIGAE